MVKAGIQTRLTTGINIKKRYYKKTTMDKPNHIYLHIKTRYFASTKFDKPSYIYIYKIFLEEQRGGREKFPTAKKGGKSRERERDSRKSN